MKLNKINRIIVICVLVAAIYFFKDFIELAKRQSWLNINLFGFVFGFLALDIIFLLYYFIFDPEEERKITCVMLLDIPLAALVGYILGIYGLLSFKPIQKIFLLVSENSIGYIMLSIIVGLAGLFVFGLSVYIMNEIGEIVDTPTKTKSLKQ